VKTRQTKNRQQKTRQRRMTIARKKIAERKRRIERRLKHKAEDRDEPMFRARNIQFELADRTQAICYGGIGLMHSLARESGLIDAIDRNVELLKFHFPYHESDHVLNIAYNALTDGKSLEDLEHKRNDAAYLDALGTARIPDPTTAGDFCRRFKSVGQIESLQRAIDEARQVVWARQPDEFFERATVDMDGHIVETGAECMAGIDISYDGRWGYHPLLLSLAETGEPLRIVNRAGNRPSHEGAAAQCDGVAEMLRAAGFRNILFRGDTDFSQSKRLDRWDAGGIVFHFGYDAMPNLVEIADDLADSNWERLRRPPRYTVKTGPRAKPERVKERIVVEREFKNIVLNSEDVAEFAYRPTACKKTYRMIVIRKNLSVEKGENVLFDDIRYFFYITNDRNLSAADIVFSCNNRCNQENLIEQLSNGPRAFRAPVDNLYSNGAYMLMASLAWTLKAWSALWLPETGRWKEKRRAEKRKLLRMEFRTFVNTLIRVPCQIVKTGRRIVYRVLSWNESQPVFWRLAEVLRC
jgi:hypothetical protein